MAYSGGKARFWLSYTGGRESKQEHGISPGYGVHVRGWNTGIRITPRVRSRDEFDVYLTTGSHNEGRSVQLGTVHNTPDGPVWEPETKPGKPGKIPVRVRTAGHPSDQYAMLVVAAIPVQAHLNKTDPDEYACVVISGSWASGREPTFGTVLATRDGDGWVTDSRAYDMGPLGCPRSLVGAVTEMIRMAGHERPACTRKHEQEK